MRQLLGKEFEFARGVGSAKKVTKITLLCVVTLLWSPAVAGGKPDAATLAPPAALKLEGVPPITQALAADIAPYGDFVATRFVAWHPTEQDMLILRRAGNTNQLFLQADPMGKALQLTKGKEPVLAALYEPKRGDYILFARDVGGDEATQIYRIDPKTLEEKQLTANSELHTMGPWNNAQDKLIVTARALDRSGKREQASVDVFAINPMQPEARFKLATLSGAGWRVVRWLDRENRLILSEYESSTKSTLWSLDLATGKRTLISEGASDDEDAAQDRWLYRRKFDGDFGKLTRIDLRSGDRQWVTKEIEHDIDTWSIARSNKRIAVLANVNGGTKLKLYDSDLSVLAAPTLPNGLVTSVAWHKNGRDLALSIESAESPGEVFSVDVDSATVTRWTQHAPVIGVKRPFSEADAIKWRSFDGLNVTGFLHRPNARDFPGKRPVIISIRGGPESQSRPGFRGRNNFWINERGYAIIYPNVRGSTGFGKKFLEADNAKKRQDSVRDIGALLDWIQTQSDLDSSRVAVMGGSYGGYMALAASMLYSDRLCAAFNSVGISHFVSFLENTETYRRDLRRSEYGDERDPTMRKFLDSISPLSNAEKIKVPLMVSHGKNDPRVPHTEAEQIVKKVRANGQPVWYLLAEDEGHGFAKKVNADFQFAATTAFYEKYLQKKNP
jgi:dipeptidyl aminopeptidase/acylaminoacyl peptidase